MSTVEVIVPCYRYGRYLRDCVESVLAQSGVDVRVLVIDDASPDNTPEVCAELTKQDARVHVIRHQANKGHIATYNEGIEWLSADYMLLLSADDYLLPNALSRATCFMNSHPDVGFTYGRAIMVESDAPEIDAERLEQDPGFSILNGAKFIELSGAANIVPTPTAVVRTALQKQVGGYAPQLPHSGDMEMWMRLAVHARVGVLKAYQAVYRRHACNMSLAYTAQGCLPDLQQREAALEFFFARDLSKVPESDRLRSKLTLSLACSAVSLSSAAFNRGDVETCNRLSDYALRVNPRVRASLPWIKLACKRLVGNTVWHGLRPTVSRFRAMRLRANHVTSSITRSEQLVSGPKLSDSTSTERD